MIVKEDQATGRPDVLDDGLLLGRADAQLLQLPGGRGWRHVAGGWVLPLWEIDSHALLVLEPEVVFLVGCLPERRAWSPVITLRRFSSCAYWGV